MENNTEKMSKPASRENAKPVQVIRNGAIAASIWQRQSPAGFSYFDYSISRSWKSLSTGRTGYSSNFFDKHREELVRTIEQASQWIEANSSEGKEDVAKEAIAA